MMIHLDQATFEDRIDAGQAIVGADLSALSLRATDLDGVTLERCSFAPEHDLTGLDLSGSLWRHCFLPAVSLRNCVARNAVFEDCCFYAPDTTAGATLRFSDLRDTRFLRCDLQLTAFDGCDLHQTCFDSSTLRGASFARCTVSRKASTRAGNARTGNTRAVGRYAPHPTITIRNCDLGYASLSALDLTDACMTGCSLAHCDLSRSDLTGATLTGNTFLETDLTQTDLSRANLRHSTLTGLRLTDLRGYQSMEISADQQHILLEQIGLHVHAE